MPVYSKHKCWSQGGLFWIGFTVLCWVKYSRVPTNDDIHTKCISSFVGLLNLNLDVN